MNNNKSTLKGFRKPRLDEEMKTEISKGTMVRLNIDIEQTKLQKFKLYLVKNNKTMKDVLTSYIDQLTVHE